MAAAAGATVLSEKDWTWPIGGLEVSSDIIVGLLALAVAAATAVTTFLDPERRRSNHQDAGTKYNALRNKARVFHDIDSSQISSDQELVQHLKELTKERDELNRASPAIPEWAFKKARRGIEAGEAEYNIDKSSRTS